MSTEGRGEPSRRAVVGGALGGLTALALSACAGNDRRTARSATASTTRGTPSSTSGSTSPAPTTSPSSPSLVPTAGPAEMAARATVPVLCWHQLRDFTSSDSQGSQLTVAYPHLRRRKLTATFFAMTVVLDKPDWLSRKDLKTLHDNGMTIGAHTWDHHRVDRYTGTDWALQLERPKELLERVVGAPVEHFAYPYGAWNRAALSHLAAAGYRSAYQLMDHPMDPTAPQLTLRRLMVPSAWSGAQLVGTWTSRPPERLSVADASEVGRSTPTTITSTSRSRHRWRRRRRPAHENGRRWVSTCATAPTSRRRTSARPSGSCCCGCPPT